MFQLSCLALNLHYEIPMVYMNGLALIDAMDQLGVPPHTNFYTNPINATLTSSVALSGSVQVSNISTTIYFYPLFFPRHLLCCCNSGRGDVKRETELNVKGHGIVEVVCWRALQLPRTSKNGQRREVPRRATDRRAVDWRRPTSKG